MRLRLRKKGIWRRVETEDRQLIKAFDNFDRASEFRKDIETIISPLTIFANIARALEKR